MGSYDLKQEKPSFEAHFLGRRDCGDEIEKGSLDAKSGFFEMIWIKKGRGSCRVDLHQFPIANDTLYCLFPGQLHFFDPDGEITGYRIAFAPDFLAPDFGRINGGLSFGLGESAAEVPIVQLNGDFQAEIEQVVRQMIWEYNNSFLLKFNLLKGLLKIFVAYFSRQVELSKAQVIPKNSQPIFESFIYLVEKRFGSYKLVNQYADELAITPNYLSEVVKRTSGFSASYFIHKRVILEAKRIAIHSDFTMKEIAFQIGFEDPSQFSKFFKLKTGTTFTEFRKKNPTGGSKSSASGGLQNIIPLSMNEGLTAKQAKND